MPEPIDIAEGRRLLDAATPEPFVVSDDNGVFAHVQSLYRIEKDGWKERVASNMRTTDAELIVWARNNLPALLDRLERWAVALDAGANILENNAKMLEHLVMDTPKDQELNDKVVEVTRRSAGAMRKALDGDQ
ncbi:hypothetical protein AAI421_14575 [Rhodococcus aetherivorans]|uniref:hypothetical protein n=1 Tax=Rhodococcus aetherivorans TaxID=191292 RepID=UPI0031E0372D